MPIIAVFFLLTPLYYIIELLITTYLNSMQLLRTILILFFLTNLQLFSQWENFNMENSDLPSNRFFGIALDSKNNLWLGSQEGLVKYDGNEWVVYNTENSELPLNSVSYIGIDKNDLIWSSGNGNYAFNFDGINWTFFNATNEIGTLHGFDIDFDSENRPWYATSRFAKFYDEGTWKVVEHGKDESGFSLVKCVELDKEGVIWCGTNTDGIYSFYEAKLIKYYTGNSDIPTGRISSLAIDSLNNIWIGTQKSQIVKSEVLKDKWTVFEIEAQLLRNRIEQIRVDEKGDIWAASGLRLLHFDGFTWDTLHLDADTSGGTGPYIITDFIFNKFGNIWVTTDVDSGIYKYTRNVETSVEDDLSKSISIYPNPATDQKQVTIASSELINTITFTDISGNKIVDYPQVNSYSYQLSVDNLAKGVYFITVNGVSKKLVIK